MHVCQSHDDVASHTHTHTLTVPSLGIGDRISESELRQMASLPQRENDTWFRSPTFEALNTITETLVSRSCSQSRRKYRSGLGTAEGKYRA